MATKTKPHSSRKKPAKDSDGAAAKPAARRGRKPASFDFRNLVSEIRDLRTLREKYNVLVQEHNGLLGTLKDLSAELGTSARKAWGEYRGGKGSPSVSGISSTRVRTASDLVDSQYDKMAAALPTAWTSKRDICKAAGLDPREANTAFRRLVTGFKRDGKSHPARLESNGKRGTEGRYRKA